MPKSRTALSRYGHQLVIGNELHRRKFEVVFVERQDPGAEDEYKETWLRLEDLPSKPAGGEEVEIEEVIIQELVKRHNHWIESAQ